MKIDYSSAIVSCAELTDPMLDTTLDAARVAVCVKNRYGLVLSQNERCVAACGQRQGSVCADGCMKLLAADASRQWQDWGCSVYRNSRLNDGHYDVSLICSDQHIVTFLQPLEQVHERAMAHYRDKGLTPRELQVAGFLVRGMSNTRICEQLSISRATLRTHLNRIYTKLRERGETAEFLPGNRTADTDGAREQAQ